MGARWQAVRSLLGLKRFASESSGPLPVDQLMTLIEARAGRGGAVTRDQAMSVPAVLQARRDIVSIATLPLAEYVAATWERLDNPLLRQIDPDVANVVTMAQTLEDLQFEAIAWWETLAVDFNGYPVSCRRVDPSTVSLTPPNTYRSRAPLPSGEDPRGAVVYVDGRPVPFNRIIRFDSPMPPLRVAGAKPIRRALLLDAAAELYASSPRPLDYFTAADDVEEPSDDVIEAALDDWREFRAQNATAYVPRWLRYNEVSAPTPQELQLAEQQKQATLDIANAAGGDPEDFGVSTTSRTYANAQDRRQDKINTNLAPYMRAITDRLSMPDVTRRGRVVAFDLDEYLRANAVDRWAINEKAVSMQIAGPEEIRLRERMGPRPPGTEPAPKPAPADGGDQADAADGGDQVDAADGGDQVDAADGGADLTAAAVHTFAADGLRTYQFDATHAEFSVDVGKRTIEGWALPYNRMTERYGVRFDFAPGSIQWSDPKRVKLMRDHKKGSAVGYAEALTDTPKALRGRYKVRRGPDGDDALMSAEDGVDDGLSVGVEFDMAADTIPHPKVKGALRVVRATLRETSLTATPQFDDARVTRVTATHQEGTTMEDETTETPAAAPAAPAAPAAAPATVQLTAEDLVTLRAWQAERAQDQAPAVVDPTRAPVPVAVTATREALPYRFSREQHRTVFRSDAEHDFSTDVLGIMRLARNGEDYSAPLARVNGLIKAAFADVETADVTALNPNRHRPEMWEPQQDFATPLWDMVAAGDTDGTKFDIPKFNSSAGLVNAATEKVEPASGSFVAELQTITPGQVWGKCEITRQAYRSGGSPQFSGILWDQMLREYYEDREASVATFLNTLTAANDITLTGRPATTPDNDDDRATAASFEAAVARLGFVRGGNRFRAFAVHQDLFEVFARVTDAAGRPLYPMNAPQNANGGAESLFATLNIAGVRAVGAWALGTGGQTTPVNSWLFDPAKVRGWASAPERLFWDFGATVQTANMPQLSFVTLGIYGDVAFGNTNINGVRQVIFDPSV